MKFKTCKYRLRRHGYSNQHFDYLANDFELWRVNKGQGKLGEYHITYLIQKMKHKQRYSLQDFKKTLIKE